ncbi:MAG: hypothetical protein COX48_00580 [bacterium (Candidatus Stahlbacteria) CG23_combo_of_CG06-09_8_20_14_all_34_7]|nr:MAG: hypothetical protein COX48_00580 [bacterium (Candidatus Stahlbacteria) CG23_combo_of_CG06-09_8_20_14_all_34_7]
MFRVILSKITLRLYIGILKEEKVNKNTIVISIEYNEKRKYIVDYSSVYALVLKTAHSKKWLLLEDMAESIYKEIIKSNKQIMNLMVSVKKINPVKMKKCKDVEVIYDNK